VAQALRITQSIPNDHIRNLTLLSIRIRTGGAGPHTGGAGPRTGGACRRAGHELEKIIERIRALPDGETILEDILAQHPSLKDNISLDIITDPVEVGTGIIYDCASIEEWKKTNTKCPTTRETMTKTVRNVSFYNLMVSILKPILEQKKQKKRQSQQDT